jgi:NADH:ubiquinone oxidoreductase subunit 5 (subunit L)/multisubunit Na+/H+ antiporter MnhA subunit
LALGDGVLHALALIGTATAALSAVASLWQRNYKRGLAYSTCSQLGYMFAAVGFGAPFAALFHLVTHAAFKALLFLCAGAVIHAAHGEEELGRLAGMRRALPQIALLALIGSLALCGLPVLTAGAFSKDLILEAGLERAPLLGWLLTASVFLTGLYAGRLFFGVFGPAPAERAPGELHLPDRLLVWPMLPLAAGALLLGWFGGPLASLLGQQYAMHLLSPLGLGAGALGLLGFYAAFLWQRAAAGQARLPALGLDWVPRAAGVGRAMGSAVASLHNGRLGLYMFASVIGVGLILLMAIGRGA